MGGASRGTAVVWAVAAVLATLAVMRLTASGGGADGGAPVRIDREPQSAGAQRAEGVFVHVAGAVRRPGLVRLGAGARVAEAVQRAGGLTRRADLAGVNLAAQIEDGQQVVVPVRGAAAVGTASPAPGGSGSGGSGSRAAAPGTAGTPKLSLAGATAEQLDQIDGIGPTLAERILEYRTENGGFRSVDELREVEGIGEKRFETLRDAVQP